MNNAQTQVSFEEVEVAVAMQEGVAVCDAEGGDEAVDCFADSVALGTETTVVHG